MEFIAALPPRSGARTTRTLGQKLTSDSSLHITRMKLAPRITSACDRRIESGRCGPMVPGHDGRQAGRPRRLTAHRIAEGPDVRSAGDFVWLASPHAPSLFARRTITSL